jgi:hypothetical protein
VNGRHRLTKAGLKRDIAELQALLRAEQTKSARIADDLALCQRDRREDKEHAARQHETDTREVLRLQAALQAWHSRWDNAHPIHVPAPRDLRTADERPTVPTDVSSLRPIIPITPQPASPDATNPAHIPAAQGVA